MQRKFGRRAVVVGASTGLASLVVGPAVAADSVKIGSLFPLSGPLALLGGESSRGLDIAVDEINAKGGLQGRPIALTKGDAVDNSQAIGEARRLISQEGVKAIIGTYGSSLCIAASQVAELAAIPYFETGAVADQITQRGFQYLYRTGPTAADIAATSIGLIVDDLTKRLGKSASELKVAILHEDSSYGTAVGTQQADLARKASLDVVQVYSYPATTVDLSSVILGLKQKKVDIVLHTGYQNDTVLFLQQAHEAAFKPSAIIGGGGGYSLQPTALAVGPEIIQNVISVDLPQYEVNHAAAPGLDGFIEAYRAKFGTLPRSGHSLAVYVGSKALLQAIASGKSLEPDAIIDAVARVDIPDGQTADGYGIKFNKSHQNERARMLAMQWIDGKLVTIYPKTNAVAELRL